MIPRQRGETASHAERNMPALGDFLLRAKIGKASGWHKESDISVSSLSRRRRPDGSFAIVRQELTLPEGSTSRYIYEASSTPVQGLCVGEIVDNHNKPIVTTIEPQTHQRTVRVRAGNGDTTDFTFNGNRTASTDPYVAAWVDDAVCTVTSETDELVQNSQPGELPWCVTMDPLDVFQWLDNAETAALLGQRMPEDQPAYYLASFADRVTSVM